MGEVEEREENDILESYFDSSKQKKIVLQLFETRNLQKYSAEIVSLFCQISTFTQRH